MYIGFEYTISSPSRSQSDERGRLMLRACFIAVEECVQQFEQIAWVAAEIISSSEIPPVIIIMGDHGPTGVPSLETPQGRMSILNAYYVKDESKAALYPAVTPVTSFRIIFNHYVEISCPLLEDTSYYTGDINDFTHENLVPNECAPEK